jgi:hypothetical protein
VYRVAQAVRALFAFAQPVDEALAARYLPPPLLPLFYRMTRDEQLHSLNVLRDVLDDPEATPPALAAAALLHDVGKCRYPMRVWQRSLMVAVKQIAPDLARRLAEGDPAKPFTRPFVVRRMHPTWSAEIITAALENPPHERRSPGREGETQGIEDRETLLWLVTHHQDDADQWRDHRLFSLLKRLQRADDAN